MKIKINLKKINKYKIAILYSDDFFIRSLILGNISSITIPIYPNNLKFEFNYRVIYKFLHNLILYKLNLNKDFFKNLYKIYIISIFDCIDAEIIITYIDNSEFFYEISELNHKYNHKRIYMAIQNGARSHACVGISRENKKKIVCNNTILYCYGQRDIDLYKSYGHQISNHIPIGTLVSGYYKSTMSKHNNLKLREICFISQWDYEFFHNNLDKNVYLSSVYKNNKDSINLLTNYLRQLSLDTNFEIKICLRSDSKYEYEYYSEICHNFKIIKKINDKFLSYKEAENSELVIALNSTMLSEIFLWENKVLWCNPLAIESFSMSEAGICYVEGNYIDFKDRINFLINLDIIEYKKMTQKNAKYINNINENYPPHLFIRGEIENIINSNKSTNTNK